MKNGIPCNETHFTNGKDRNRITFRFVTDDENTPSSCTVRIGDTDPMTGEAITDMDFFRDYHRQADSEIHRNLKAIRPEYTKKQKEWRKAETERFIRDFEQANGYSPSRDDIQWHLEQMEPERYHLSLDGIRSEEGKALDEYIADLGCFDEDPFGADLPDEILALREVAESLTGRLKAVYEAMLQKAAGLTDRVTYTTLAKEWNVPYNRIIKDTRKIEKMIRERICS